MEPPKHLEPFLDGTPLALERLKLAWSDLSDIDRIALLSTFFADTPRERKSFRFEHLRKQVIDLALGDKNPYIRYLGAKEVHPPFNPEDKSETPKDLEEEARFEKVRSDHILLVRAAYGEKWGRATPRELEDASSFWNRNQIERLALVNGLHGGGEEIAKLLRYAVKELLPIQAVKIEEIVDVLSQYTAWKSISERLADSEDYAFRFHDRNASFLAHASIKALWEVIPELPKNLSSILIECLPLTDGMRVTLSAPLSAILDEYELEFLLLRSDISLKEFRRTIYEDSTNDKLRQAAVSSPHFELRDSDISDLVYGPMEQVDSGKKKFKELALLAFWCKSATCVQMEAINDLIRDAPSAFYPGGEKWDEIQLGGVLQAQRAKRESGNGLRDEFLPLRLYAFARRLAPIKKGKHSFELSETILERQDLIVPHNPWQTYLNLRKIVRLNQQFLAFRQWFENLSRSEQFLLVGGTIIGIFMLYR